MLLVGGGRAARSGRLFLFFCAALLRLVAGQSFGLSNGRRYVLHAPIKYVQGHAIPLWILAPGSGDTAEVFLAMSDLQPLADKYTFAFAVLEGADLNLNVVSSGQADPWRPDDVAYTREVLRHASKTITVDMAKIRCVGFSRGGRFCSRLASELSSYVQAIAPVSGIRFPKPNNNTRPMPIIAFHGTNDPINPWWGHGNPTYWHEPVVTAVQQWAKHNGCKKYVEEQASPAVKYLKNLDCKDGADVLLVQIAGGGHTWPGTTRYEPPEIFGQVSHDLDARLDIVHFFDAHSWSPPCRTAQPGEVCYKHVMWVKNRALKSMPQLYDGLGLSATFEEIQAVVHKHIYADCAKPCPKTPEPRESPERQPRPSRNGSREFHKRQPRLPHKALGRRGEDKLVRWLSDKAELGARGGPLLGHFAPLVRRPAFWAGAASTGAFLSLALAVAALRSSARRAAAARLMRDSDAMSCDDLPQ